MRVSVRETSVPNGEVLKLMGSAAARGYEHGAKLVRQVVDFLECFIIEEMVGSVALYEEAIVGCMFKKDTVVNNGEQKSQKNLIGYFCASDELLAELGMVLEGMNDAFGQQEAAVMAIENDETPEGVDVGNNPTSVGGEGNLQAVAFSRRNFSQLLGRALRIEDLLAINGYIHLNHFLREYKA